MVLEHIVLALCLCVIALRMTYTEGPVTQSTALPANLSGNIYSLSVSTVLVLSFVIWFLYNLCSKRFLYRFTALEIGLCLFCIAAVIAGIASSNKRAAITDAVCLISPVLMAVLLIQILDSHSKIKLVLTVIAALAVASAYQSVEQFFVSNQTMIDQYEQAPQTMLEPLGIHSGSFRQFFLEHRLYSRDVRGFFTTGNSAGSFAILASFAAVALFIEKLKNHQSQTSGSSALIPSGIAIVIIISSLFITHSKGAIAAFMMAAVMFIVFLYFGNWLKMHRKAILLTCLLFFITAGCAAAAYGLAYDRLPGGKSMLVRWQYWYASAKMYADHWLSGVGPGNFAHFYTHYKPAAALESVADPHNFLLSVLTQYGLLGLIGFLALVSVPLWRLTSPSLADEPRVKSHESRKSQLSFRTLNITYLTIISAALLLIRPMLIPITTDDAFGVIIYMVLTLYVAPVIAFAVGFWLLTAPSNETQNTNRESQTKYISAVLFCAVLGVLLHNLVDFAIFELPVLTAFWAIVACLIAINQQQKFPRQSALSLPIFAKVTAAVAAFIILGAYFCFAWWPVYKSTTKIRKARSALSSSRFQQAHSFLNKANDRLSPTAPGLNGRLYLQRYNEMTDARVDLLKKAETYFITAIKRDKADFKNYEKLSEVYRLLAKTTQTQEKIDWLNHALESIESAVERYPGCARLRVELAGIAEQLGKTDIALAQYKKTVEIEDAFRNQFKIIYPKHKTISRLGEEKYNRAKQQIKFLANQSTP